HWCYQSQKCELPQCEGTAKQFLDCRGDRQSPVNIVTRNVVYEKSLKPLSFEGYDVKGSAKWDVQNNGHTVKVALDASPKIGGGGLERKYKAVEFHFHWGLLTEQQILSPGSEHSIDGEKYPMEVGGTASKKSPDGLAVLAFFVEVGGEIFNCPSQISQPLVEKYTRWNENISLSGCSLLPPEEDLERYYRYQGSLTTPDCYQGVIWTIFETPVQLSLRQLSQFAALHFDGKNSTPMMENFRPAQPLNGREVLWSGASIALPTAQLLLLGLALTCTLSSLSH
uniref:Carbonic anhydrase 4 n=1 Tax=Geospiza parvula TaxID=87175 RepID=A0A8U8BZZ9_GEOPR